MKLQSLFSSSEEVSLPSPMELQMEIPCDTEAAHFIEKARNTIEAILNGWDKRLLLIVGPCSIHDPGSAYDYAIRLKKLSDFVSDQFFIVMRTYFEKPRTILGWKGLLLDPDCDGSFNLAKGAYQTRTLLAQLAKLKLPAAAELLDINSTGYYTDFLSWGCVGARTSSSPLHRQLAASLQFPIGFKNSTEGSIDHPIHSILAASASHVYLGISPSGQMARIEAEGNPLCHVVLRGGITGSNFDAASINQTIQQCRNWGVRDKIVVDCSHDNCGKKPENQRVAFESVLEQIQSGNHNVVGLMLESNLFEGSQKNSPILRYGVSITDPCLGWDATEALIFRAHTKLKSSRY